MIPAIHTQHQAITLGKYRIAACPRALPSGRFMAQVSVASGQGSASTARIMCFIDDFATLDAAANYAIAQGLDWVHETHSATKKSH